MKKIKERVTRRLRKNRAMTTISIRIPEDVIDDLKEIAPVLGFSGYQSLIRSYIGQGLRKDLLRFDGSQLQALAEALRLHNVPEDTISEAMAAAWGTAEESDDVDLPDKNLSRRKPSPSELGTVQTMGRHYFVERTEDGKYAISAAGSKRASAIFPTQREAIEHAKKLNPSDLPHVERVRGTLTGSPDRWRSA